MKILPAVPNAVMTLGCDVQLGGLCLAVQLQVFSDVVQLTHEAIGSEALDEWFRDQSPQVSAELTAQLQQALSRIDARLLVLSSQALQQRRERDGEA